jgi:PhoPQ-activated pathogenicity-related protein
MVKSAVRGMDAVQQFARRQWSLDVHAFTVTGASKRGWTTWLTAAVDPRVAALAPMVIDILNMEPQLDHQQAVWGAPSYKIHDYTDRDLHELLQTEEGKTLQEIVDPFQYRRHLTQPKLILLGTNDHYWPVDALNLYWDELAGEKSILYVPNNGHGLRDYGRLFGSLHALHEHVATGAKLPKLRWRFQATPGVVRLTVQSEPAADEFVAWVATAEKRDFREAAWKSFPTTSDGGGATYELATPENGFTAFFAEAKYNGAEMPSYFSTNIRVLEAQP